MHMKYLSMKLNENSTTSSGWNQKWVELITVNDHRKEEQVRLDMRGNAKMLKMTISMVASRVRKTSTISSLALLNSKERRKKNNSETSIGHRAQMTFSEPHNILNTKTKRNRIQTLEMKIHINGHSRQISIKITLADINHLINNSSNGTIHNIQQKQMMNIIEENMKNG